MRGQIEKGLALRRGPSRFELGASVLLAAPHELKQVDEQADEVLI